VQVLGLRLRQNPYKVKKEFVLIFIVVDIINPIHFKYIS